MPILEQPPIEVPPIGPTDAKIVFIGEAPSDRELQQGEPFVGPAGEVFNRCLSHVGLIRKEVYVTNLFKFKIMKSKKNGDILHPDGTILFSNKFGLTDRGQDYAEELFNELDNLNPNVLVPLGGPALFAVTQKKGINKWRGSIMESAYCQKFGHKVRKVIPTIHPAATLHGAPLDKYKIAADLRKIVREAEYPKYRPIQQELIPKPNFEETLQHIRNFKAYARRGYRLNFDIEILNGQVDCLSLAIDKEYAVSISLTEWTEAEEVKVASELAELFELPNIKLCNQNLLFDIVTLGQKNQIICPVTTQRLDDPMTAMGILYPDFPKSLAFLTSIKTDIPYYKDDGKVFTDKGIGKVGGSLAHRKYNCQDSCASIWCMDELDRELDQIDYRKQYEDTMNLYPVLATMMLHGVRVDKEKLEEVKVEVEKERDKLQEELNEMCGRPLNVVSSAQCQQYFYTERGIRPFTRNGSITTDEKAMSRLAKGTSVRKPIKEASLVIQIRKLRKLLSTYFSIQLDEDDRLRCSYNPRGTTSGRLSSSQTIFGTGMNMQNIPENFRQFIVPDPGHILVEIDKRQAEWVVTAYIAGDGRMMEAHEKGLDAHIRTAELITGLPGELIAREATLLKHETDPNIIRKRREEEFPILFKEANFLPRTMTCRQAGKKSNHALNYGEGYQTFALENEIPEDDAKKMVEGYHEGYPGIRNNFYTYIQRRMQTDRTLENLFGHKRRFLDPYGQKLLNKAYNYIPQSSVGWIINYGMINIYYDSSPLLKDVEILTQIHDSILLQFPESLGYENLSKGIELCCSHLDPPLEFNGRSFRIGTDFKIGYNWRDMEEVTREENSPKKFKEILNL